MRARVLTNLLKGRVVISSENDMARESTQRSLETVDAVSSLRKKLIIYFIGFTATLAGLLFGLGRWCHLRGEVIGTLISGMLSSNFGRRRTILVSVMIFVVGAMLWSIAKSEYLLIGARLFLGIAVDVASFTVPLYLSEISPRKAERLTYFDVSTNDHQRNRACVSEQHLARVLCDVWRGDGRPLAIMVGVIAIPAAIMFVGVLFLPESPRWLSLKS
jgi:hypothetical protein